MPTDSLTPLAGALSLEAASAIVDAALAARRRAGLKPLSVAVLDAGGHLVAFKREDGSGILRPDIAIGKAWGALGMGMWGRLIRDRLADRPTFQTALAASGGRFVPVPGGVLVCDASDKDEYCAIEGVQAAGLTPEPDQPSGDWQKAGL